MNPEIFERDGTHLIDRDIVDKFSAARKWRPANSGAKRQRARVDPTRLQGSWVISDDSRAAMERCELFQDLDRRQIMAVAALVEEASFQPEDYLINESGPAEYLYIITEGRAVAQVTMDHGWMSLGLIGPGEAAGWSSLIDSKLYPASVKALTNMKVARLESSGLRLLMNVDTGIGYPVQKRLSAIFCRQYEAALRTLKTAM